MKQLIEFACLNGVPDYAQFGGRTNFTDCDVTATQCIGYFDTNAPLPAGMTLYTGAFPLNPEKIIYNGPGFYMALTVPERELLINKSNATDEMGAIFEQIKMMGLDFNNQDDIDIIDKMVVAGILTAPRRDALIGV